MAESEMPGSSSAKRILVVDDDATIRLLCARVLTEAGYRVVEAEGSPEAMAVLSEPGASIDLVLADLFLPPPGFQLASSAGRYARVNGHEMVTQMLALRSELRVLYMSSHPRASLPSQQINLGNALFLQKPLSKESLLAQVAAALAAPPLRADGAPAGEKKDVQWVD